MTTPDAKTPTPYGKGWRAPWRRQWGSLGDGHTRLSHLAKRHRRALREVYETTNPRAASLVERAAAYEALATMTIKTMGSDPKSTRRAATALERAAAGCIAQLEALGVRREKPAPTITELLARHQANGAPR